MAKLNLSDPKFHLGSFEISLHSEKGVSLSGPGRHRKRASRRGAAGLCRKCFRSPILRFTNSIAIAEAFGRDLLRCRKVRMASGERARHFLRRLTPCLHAMLSGSAQIRTWHDDAFGFAHATTE